MVVEEAELSTFDLRYEGYRMRNPGLEAKLLLSMTERGIEEPLEGIALEESRILLNGFKRYRCARKLKLETAPYTSLAADTASGIIALLRTSNNKRLGILEEARFIDDLRTIEGLSVAEIAGALSRSKAWVSMRLGLLRELGDGVREKIFSGAFPIYPYMYTVRQFMRMNGVSKEDGEKFVTSVAGAGLSTREIEQLAHGYFRGPTWFRDEVHGGNFALLLEKLRRVPDSPEGVSDRERVLLKDLEIAGKYMQRVTTKSQDERLGTRAFCAQANLLVTGILSRIGAFTQALRSLDDRTRETQGDLPPSPRGDERT